jgi:Tol biopolymer transport system component
MQSAAAVAALALAAAGALAATTTRVSLDSAGQEGLGSAQPIGQYASLSSSGRLVAFSSWGILVPEDSNGSDEIYLRDLSKKTTVRVSVAHDGAQADGQSFAPHLSPNGKWLAFTSNATNLVPGDGNGANDVFLRDLKKGTLERVTMGFDGQEADASSYDPRVTDNGRFVVFSSLATNLVPGDTNGTEDVFLRDRKEGTTERISVDSFGEQVPDGGGDPSVSANGRWVVFSSISTGLVDNDGNGIRDVFLRDRLLGTTTLVSFDVDGNAANRRSAEPIITPNGRYVVFSSQATDIVAGDANGINGWDVFVYDTKVRTISCASVEPAGTMPAAGQSYQPSLSPNGRFVVFASWSPTLVAGDTNSSQDIFVRDMKKGLTERVSLDASGAQVTGFSEYPQVSANGKTVVFQSDSTGLVTGDFNGSVDLFARTR